MRRRLFTFSILILLILLSLSSCRPQAEYGEAERISSWSDLFVSFWENMNTHYVFWDQDSPGNEWDEILYSYLPLFDSLSGEDSTETAAGYFYDIVKALSDGHYTLNITDRGNRLFFYSNYIHDLLRSSGYTDEEIFTMFLNSDIPSYSDLMVRTDSILQNSFKVSIPDSRKLFSGYVIPERYLEECFVFYYQTEGNAPSCYIFGRTAENVLYIGLSDFSFSDYLDGYHGADVKSAAIAFLRLWRETIRNESSGINGLVIDLRGNTGGRNSDLPLLWNCLFKEDAYIGDTRTKDGMNRLDYGPWVKYIIKGNDDNLHDFDKPIALITNRGTVSNGEITVLLFKALDDYYGFDVDSFGERSAGGFGSATNNDPYVFNAGQFDSEYISCSTQSRSMRYRNGKSFENTGIEPDIVIAESADADLCLETALGWIQESIH